MKKPAFGNKGKGAMKLPDGFLASGIHCGIKKKKLDLGLIYVCDSGRAAAVFTKNANPSYSVTVSKKNISGPIKAIIVNSGNANCYSHKQGLRDTNEIVGAVADYLDIAKESVLIASTGIIGKPIPKKKIIDNISGLVKSLTDDGDDFANSILTTDAFVKTARVAVDASGKKGSVIGFAKGAGMIYPNMATMLGFVLTDIDIPKASLQRIAKEVSEETFNSISVDGCMSTNDTVFFVSSRKIPLLKKDEALAAQKIKSVCLSLAKLIVKDGEGASKFVTLGIKGAKTVEEAKRAAFSLANSNLFKCALYGANANWGRIISALGQSGIKVSENIKIKADSLKKKNVTIFVDLKRGGSSWTVYTTDLTPKYIKINAEYS
jgi:glutamate N-acetyltransferase / amino-acid N-acetyltransferase